jgi:hypothetical protein
MFHSKSIALILAIGLLGPSCSENKVDPLNGYAERDVAGRTWFFPSFAHWTPLDLMTIDEYQELVNGSHLIDMAPIYGYVTSLDGCRSGIVVSVVSKFSNSAQSEYDFVKKSPTRVKELYFSNDDERIRALYSIYSIKYRRKTTRVVLLFFKETIVGFELRSLSGCSKVSDEELIEFVQKFIKLNT